MSDSEKFAWGAKTTDSGSETIASNFGTTGCFQPFRFQAERIEPINIRRFSPTMDALGLGVTERAIGLRTGDFNPGLMVDFAFDPLF